MNYLELLTDLDGKSKNPPGFWPDQNLAEAELRQLLRNSLPLWLELARAAEDCVFYYGGDKHSGAIKRLKLSLEKLRGERE